MRWPQSKKFPLTGSNRSYKEKEVLIKPVNDFVIISPFPEEEEKAGNIVVAEPVRRAPGRGRVIEVAVGVDDILKDDVVVYRSHAGVELKLQKDTFLILRGEDIYLTVREEAKEVKDG